MASSAPLSHSAVHTYLECPLRYRFLYVQRLPETPRGYFSFGRTIHAVLEELVRPLVVPAERKVPTGGSQRTLDQWPLPGTPEGSGAPVMELPELERLYARLWVGDGYQSPDEEERYRQLGLDILRRFQRRIQRQPPAPVAVEEHLEARWQGIPIHGYLDRIDRTESGGLAVVDYKTSRELSGEDARGSDQLALYQVLVEHNYSLPVESLTLLHLRSLVAHSSPPRGPRELETLYDRVGNVRDGIRREAFEPTPGRHCQRCEFKALCPEFRVVPDEERVRLSELVDRFVALRAEEDRLEGELRATAERLHREAERLGVHRVPGSRETLLRQREEAWHVAPDAARPLLEARGVRTALDPGQPIALDRLLEDHRLDPESRRQLKEKASRNVRWYWSVEGGRDGG